MDASVVAGTTCNVLRWIAVGPMIGTQVVLGELSHRQGPPQEVPYGQGRGLSQLRPRMHASG